MAEPRVAIIVLTWNGLADTLECLDSLRLAATQGPPFAVILVDNGSRDGTPEMVAKRFPEVMLLTFAENLGFAAGNNRGAELAMGLGVEYLLFLNNDAMVQADTLPELLAVMDRYPNVGIAGPLTKHYDTGKLVPTGHRISCWTAGVSEAGTPPSGVDLLPVDYVWGCGLLVRASLWRRLEGFDPRYFAYFEDADLCLRAKRSEFLVALAPRAMIRHKVASAGNKMFLRQVWLRTRNHVRFFATHSAPWQLLVALPVYFGYRLPLFLYASVRVYYGLKRREGALGRKVSLRGGTHVG